MRIFAIVKGRFSDTIHVYAGRAEVRTVVFVSEIQIYALKVWYTMDT